jgi:glycosyltransferase involved in cell wall biosynthesis
MKNFNLLQIIPSLDSGGTEQGTVDVANFVGEKDLGSFIVSNGGYMLKLLNKRKTSHFKLPIHSKNVFTMPFIINKLSKIISDKHINIVHVRSRFPAWHLQFIRNTKFKTVSTFHNVYRSQNLFKKIYNKGLSRVDHIVAISDFVKFKIIDTYKINENKITVINRGVDTKFFDPTIYNENFFFNFLNKYHLSSEKKIILYPGRLTRWKGQINFLKIMESYKDDQVICYFVGDDKNKSYTAKLINEINKRHLQQNCKIIGHLSKEDLKMMYKCADIVISAPLEPEGFGRTISESLAMKKIILCYDYGGAHDQLNGLDEIYKVSLHDQTEMKNKIDKIIKLSESYKDNLGSISRRHIIENFSKEKMLENYLNFYQTIIL